MDRSNKNSSRSAEVYRALMDKNFPEELCREIAYKYIAILEDRERFRKKHEMEEAQAAITKIYNEGL